MSMKGIKFLEMLRWRYGKKNKKHSWEAWVYVNAEEG